MIQRPPHLLLALALASLALTSCGRDVAVPAPDYADPVCAEVALPDTVNGAGRRPTDQAGTAAWGEPPITWRCGVARPAALDPTSSLLDVNGIAWLPIDAAGGDVFVAVTWPTKQAPVYVEVAVPDAYSAPADVLLDLAPAMGR